MECKTSHSTPTSFTQDYWWQHLGNIGCSYLGKMETAWRDMFTFAGHNLPMSANCNEMRYTFLLSRGAATKWIHSTETLSTHIFEVHSHMSGSIKMPEVNFFQQKTKKTPTQPKQNTTPPPPPPSPWKF